MNNDADDFGEPDDESPEFTEEMMERSISGEKWLRMRASALRQAATALRTEAEKLEREADDFEKSAPHAAE